MLQKEKEEKQKWIILFLLVSLVGLLLRTFGLSWISDDMRICLTAWMDELEGGQGLSSLKSYSGDYNMPYITVLWLIARLPVSRVVGVKAFSILFDYIGAFFAGLLVEHFYKNRFLVAYTLVLLSPVTMANSAWWGQCDMVYTAFLLIMLYCLIRERYPIAMIALGCAFSFKLQAILLLPVILIHYWKTRKYSILQFLLVPITMVVLCIPAILGGHSPMVAFDVYTRQMGRYPYLFVSYPNIWTFFEEAPYYRYQYAGIAAMLILLGVFAYYVIREKNAVSNKRWLEYALFTVAVEMAFLPCMHERYGYLLEILAIVVAVINPSRWWIATGYYIPTVIVYIWQQFYHPLPEILPIKWAALLYLTIFTAFYITVFREEREAIELLNPELEHKNFAVEKDSSPSDSRMLSGKKRNIEQRILNGITPLLFPAVILITALLSFYVKRMPSDYTAPSYLADFLEQEGNVHTALYMLGIQLLTYLPRMPVLLMKTLIAGMDVVLAYVAGCMGAGCDFGILFSFRKVPADKRMKFLVIYGLLLMLPPVFLNGVLWVHVDCLCMTLLLLSFYAFRKSREYLAVILYALCVAIQVQYIWFLPVGILICRKANMITGKKWLSLGATFVGGLLILPLPALFLGYSLPEVYLTYLRGVDLTGVSGIPVYNFFALWPQPGIYGMLICVATYVLLMIWQIQVGRNTDPFWLLCWGYYAAVIFIPGMLCYYVMPVVILALIGSISRSKYGALAGGLILTTTIMMGEYLYQRGTIFSPVLYEVALIAGFLFMTLRMMKPEKQSEVAGLDN